MYTGKINLTVVIVFLVFCSYNYNHHYFITLAQSAVGWDHQEKLAQHSSQSDASKGFGGKFGIQNENQDKVCCNVENLVSKFRNNSK